jgi:uncharacterized protein involved in exopolysaccharide biosynthesis
LVAIAALTCVLITRRYTATAEIQIQQPQATSFSGDNGTAQAGASDPNASSTNLQTQTTVLTSPAMAMKVIEDLKLESMPRHSNLTSAFPAGSRAWSRRLRLRTLRAPPSRPPQDAATGC